MLTTLRVRAFAILDDVEVTLGPGLQVITGETGAGKSVLIGALQLVLGARVRPDVVRDGAEAAEVDALFDLTHAPQVQRALAEITGETDPELAVSRVVRPGGRSRATVNGRLVTAQQLARLTGPLVDICSQHEFHTLADVATHLDHLDAYADLEADALEMSRAWDAHRQATEALEAWAEVARRRRDREATVRAQLDEIDAVDPEEHEEDELAAEHARLAHAAALAETTSSAESVLHTDDDAVTDRIARVTTALGDLRGVDADLDALADQLTEAHDAVEAVARELGRYARRVVSDPSRLATVEARMAELRRLARRYGGSPEALTAHRRALREELAAFDSADAELERLEADRHATAERAIAVARALTQRRRDAARALGQAITAELADLGMGGARIDVEVARLERRGDDLEADGARVGRKGMDRVEFLIAPNRGEPPRPLQRIASGGELSRALLAIKRVMARRATPGTFVFDEVDSGVGGAVAAAIGRKLADVARDHQVICVTHLAPIAAFADRHLRVRKEETDGRTSSAIDRLDEASHVEELARMMGGAVVTDETRAAAATLRRQSTTG